MRDLTEAWNDAQARLPDGWALEGLRCASTGVDTEQRSDEWIAAAIGPASPERHARAEGGDVPTHRGWRGNMLAMVEGEDADGVLEAVLIEPRA